MISFREIADQCDAFDKEIEDIQDARKEFWAEVREVVLPRDVKALKAAIKVRRKRRADRDGEEAYETRVTEILAEIEVGTDLATRARAPREEIQGEVGREFPNGLPPHDEDGVIIEEPAAPTGLAAVGGVSTSPLEVQACSDAPPSLSQEPDAQHEATVKPTSPMPEATRPASSQEPCTHGSGEVQDRCESTSPPIPPPIADQGQSSPEPDLTIPPFPKRGDPACVVRQT